MELLQKIDVKAAGAGQKSVENQPGSSGADGDDRQQNNVFKDQLNQQIDQSKANVSQKKTDNNQQDNGFQGKEGVVAEELRDTAEVTSGGLPETTEIDTVVAAQFAALSAPLTDIEIDLNQPLAATRLPQTGSSLPLPSELISTAVNSENLQQTLIASQAVSLTGVTAEAVKPQQSVTEAVKPQQPLTEVVMLQQKELINKVQLQKTDVATTNVRAAKSETLAVAASLSTSLSEKAITQDARYSKILSEMPTTEVIAQTTRLQQVPVTTALSAGSALAQNVTAPATGLINESASSLNTSNPLSNSLNSAISANIQSPNWSQQMTQQVSYMLKGGFQQAEIKLNPAHLGPMEIKLTVNDDQASISFVAQHAPVREALDAALPRLREMLEQQGLNLADVDVSTQSEQQQAEQQQTSSELHAEQTAEQTEAMTAEQEVVVKMDVSSGVNIFA